MEEYFLHLLAKKVRLLALGYLVCRESFQKLRLDWVEEYRFLSSFEMELKA